MEQANDWNATYNYLSLFRNEFPQKCRVNENTTHLSIIKMVNYSRAIGLIRIRKELGWPEADTRLAKQAILCG